MLIMAVGFIFCILGVLIIIFSKKSTLLLGGYDVDEHFHFVKVQHNAKGSESSIASAALNIKSKILQRISQKSSTHESVRNDGSVLINARQKSFSRQLSARNRSNENLSGRRVSPEEKSSRPGRSEEKSSGHKSLAERKVSEEEPVTRKQQGDIIEDSLECSANNYPGDEIESRIPLRGGSLLVAAASLKRINVPRHESFCITVPALPRDIPEDPDQSLWQCEDDD